MKILKIVLGAVVGFLLSTLVCWGALYAYGVFVLHGTGSLFDTNPQAANAFFITWGLVSIGTTIVTVLIAGGFIKK